MRVYRCREAERPLASGPCSRFPQDLLQVTIRPVKGTCGPEGAQSPGRRCPRAALQALLFELPIHNVPVETEERKVLELVAARTAQYVEDSLFFDRTAVEAADHRLRPEVSAARCFAYAVRKYAAHSHGEPSLDHDDTGCPVERITNLP